MAKTRVGFELDFNAGKNQLVSFGRSHNSGAMDVKTDGFLLAEKLSFKILGLSLLNRIVALTLYLLLKEN